MDLSKISQDWIFNTDPVELISEFSADRFLNNPDSFKIITESIQDGISVLDDNLVVQYVNRTMEHWYDWDVKESIGNKCYQAFHDRDSPCHDCPVKKSFETCTPQAGVVQYDTCGQRLGLQMLYSIPVFDEEKKVKFVIEYVKDITVQEQYDQIIGQLQSQVANLQKQNTKLTDIILEREVLHHKSEKNLVESIRTLMEPPGKRFGANPTFTPLDGFPRIPDAPDAESEEVLSRREAQICHMIIDDMTSKEIADKLFVTQKTIDFHRSNIRRKMKLDKSVSLFSYLKALQNKDRL